MFPMALSIVSIINSYLNFRRLRDLMSLKHILLATFLPVLLAGCGAMPASGPGQNGVGSGASVVLKVTLMQLMILAMHLLS